MCPEFQLSFLHGLILSDLPNLISAAPVSSWTNSTLKMYSIFQNTVYPFFFPKQKLGEKYVCKIDMRNKMSCSFDWSVSGFHRAVENAVWGVATDVFLKVPDTVRCNSWGSYVILFDVESKGKVLTYLPRANLLGDRKLLFLGLTLQEFFSENISDDKEKKN